MADTETDIGWRIARGELPSPQRLAGFHLFALRFSGTGSAWREAHQEHVYRPPSEFLTDEMAARLAGVPVVAVHPASGSLTSAAFGQTAIGSICFGYRAGPDGLLADDGTELWAIARIGDGQAAQAMASGKYSTSPAVVFSAASGSEMLPLPDGTALLIEGRPAILDHLAICAEGVWDKGGPPSGIRNDSTGDCKMPDSDTKGGEVLDKLLSHMSDLHAKLDGMSKRLDAIEAAGKGEAEPEPDEIDPEEAEPKELAADAAAKAGKPGKARKDTGSGTDRAKAERQATEELAQAQERADAACAAWGMRAAPPMMGEAPLAYRVRMARQHQKHCGEPSFASLDLAAIAASHPAALDGIERRIYADSVAASKNPQFEDFSLHPRTRTLESGHRVTEWYGRPGASIFRALSAPAMAVTAFRASRDGQAAA